MLTGRPEYLVSWSDSHHGVSRAWHLDHGGTQEDGAERQRKGGKAVTSAREPFAPFG